MRCPSCGVDNPVGFRFCGACGSPLERTCPSCGADVPTEFRFCGACGTSLDGPVEPQPAVTTERRNVVVMFADLVGFSTIAEQLDPEELRTLIQEAFAELTREIEAREGVVEKFIGDAIMAVFGAPRAHEDDPQRAVECALAMIDVLSHRTQSSTQLRLRIGINSGLVVSGTVGDGTQTGVMGDAVNTAARLQQGAAPGEVVVSAAVWRRVRDRYDSERIGELEVKGKEQRVDAYRIIGVGSSEKRREVPLVGRREELAILDLLWSSVVKGNTHVVSLVGEPGVGKSRLLTEFAIRPGARDVRITCTTERAYGPFVDLVHEILGGAPADTDQLRELCRAIGADEDLVPLIAAFLGLAGAPPAARMADEQRRSQVFAGLWHLVVAAATQRPTLVVLDDVHWADRSSVDLLGFLLEHLGGIPLMLVLAYRPGFDHVERASLRASHTAIRLEPLTEDESIALARSYLGVAELPDDLIHVVASRAEGNPFFVEELLRALLDIGSLTVTDGAVALAQADVEIPDTVQGTILARIDRLGFKERRLLQHAAVIGRTFSGDLLESMTGDVNSRSFLESLSRAQLVVPQGSRVWSFKHALIQEATYDTLLLRQRKDLHRTVAEALERRAGDDPSTLEALAEHYARADVREKARHYAVAAGDAARDRMGFVEAEARYETAMRLWGSGDEEGRLALLMKLARSAMYASDAATARTVLVEAAEGFRALGDVIGAGGALALLGRIYWTGGETERSIAVLNDAVRLLEPLGPSDRLLEAYVHLSTVSMLAGRYDEGRSFARRGLDLERELKDDAARSNLLNTFGVCKVAIGDATGIDDLRESLVIGERSGDVEAMGRAFINLSNQLMFIGGNTEAVDVCRRGRVALRERGAPTFVWAIAQNEAEALIALGRFEDAEAICRDVREHRTEITVPNFASANFNLALTLLRRGRYEEARRLLDDVLPALRSVGGAEYLGTALAIEAELEEARGNRAAARQAMREAFLLVEDNPDVEHLALLLPGIAQLLGGDVALPLLGRVDPASGILAFEARALEARGIIEKDEALSRKAADLYSALDLPYETARSLLQAGERAEAEAILERIGAQDGPLGNLTREAMP